MIDNVRNKLKMSINKKVRIVVLGMRNHKEEFDGIVTSVSNNVFVVKTRGINRSFSYSDVLIGDVLIHPIK